MEVALGDFIGWFIGDDTVSTLCAGIFLKAFHCHINPEVGPVMKSKLIHLEGQHEEDLRLHEESNPNYLQLLH